MKYTLRHVEVFLSVAKHQSISVAAKELAMSQSAASAALQEFESRYAMQLFDRSAKRVRLNQAGKVIRTKAEQLMAQAESFERELLNSQAHQHLRIGASYTIGNYLAFHYLARFMKHYPQAKVDIIVGSTPEISAKVLNYEVDIGLIEAEIHHNDLSLTQWQEDNMVAFCSTEHPCASKKTLSDEDLIKNDWILREPGSAHRQTFDRAMSGILPSLNIRAELTQNEAVKNAVKSGLGIGCLSEIAIQDDIKACYVTALSLSKRSMHRHFYFAQHRDAKQNDLIGRWVEVCEEKKKLTKNL